MNRLTDEPSREPAPLDRLSATGQGLGLLGLEGLSTGLCLALLTLGPDLPSYLARNEISGAARSGLLVTMAAVAIAFVGIGLVALWRNPEDGPEVVRRWGLALSPLLLLGLLPTVLPRWTWVNRELTLLTIISVLGLGGQALLRTALCQRRLPGSNALRSALSGARARRARMVQAWPMAVVAMAGLGYATFFAYYTMVNHWNIRSRSFDLGLENNLMWNLIHGAPLFKSSPVFGPVGSHLSHHATFFAYVIAPVYALAPRPETLLVVQAVLMGAAVIPLFLFARRHLGPATACVIALAYLLYPPLHGANLYDFHYLSLSPLFLWTSLHFLETRRDGLAAIAIVLTLSVREDVAAGLVVVALSLVLSGTRPRAGLVVAGVAGAYFVLMKFMVMPLAGRDAMYLYIYQDLVPVEEATFAGVLKTVFGNPTYTIATLIRQDKLVYVLQILAPLAFLPLRRPLGLLFMLPGFFFTLLSTGYGPVVQISFQYTAHWTAFVFPAIVLSLAWLSRPAIPREVATNRRRAWLGALILVTVVSTYQFGALPRSGPVRGGFDVFKFGSTSADRERYRALSEIIALVPPLAKVAGSERLVPHFSSRPDAYTLRIGTFDAEYLIFPMERAELIWPAEGGPLVALLASGEFGVVAVRGPYALAARGEATTQNSTVLARLQSTR